MAGEKGNFKKKGADYFLLSLGSGFFLMLHRQDRCLCTARREKHSAFPSSRFASFVGQALSHF
jgi:hypothetical protein